MDNPADALLALSNTAAAIAESNEKSAEEDDRSSSLSELEDAPDNVELDDDMEDEEDEEEEEDDDEEDEEEEQELPQRHALVDGDSEAETERLEESPDKTKKAFQISPSKLAQATSASDDVRPEIEELTNTDVSSPMTPVQDSPLEDLSEAEDILEPSNPLNILSQAASVSNKRKRLSDVMDITSEERPRKRRTESLSDVDDEESDGESDVEKPEAATRESTVEPDEPDLPADEKEDDVEAEPEQPEAEASDDSKTKKPEQYTRSRSRRGKDPADEQEDEENEAEATDDDVEADDIDAAAKSEEEQAKRAAAMEALTALERHFATLRDKLYDDKISQLNHELSQLSAQEPDHPELLKQFECVNKYRDEKQDTELKLLVFKVGALKRKSVAERSQLHSAYFQTVRDIRERHMETMSEHFYRIQRERFKSAQVIPTYTVPFPAKKVDQVTQQAAYNREVSVLSGVAKYVGFPAAPELKPAPTSELDADLQKMGINSTASRIRNASSNRHAMGTYPGTGATSALSSSAAAANASSEQQFIESTPWANPNHPMHRLSRQNATKSPFAADHTYTAASTPAHQKRNEYTPQPVGSASTIVENPSAQQTPGTDLQSSALKQEPIQQANGMSLSTNGDLNANSPTETRKTVNSAVHAGNAAVISQGGSTTGNATFVGVNSSPLQARANLLSSLNRTASAAGTRENTRSPFRQDLVMSGNSGMSRFGFR